MSSTCISSSSREAFSRDLDKQTAAAYKIFVDKISHPTKKDVKLFFQEKLILTRMKIGFSRVPGLISIVSFKQKTLWRRKDT